MPFTLDTKISEALRVRPELRELLPAFHPAFGKLNHPLLGKVLPRLVTVRDAARVAGVDAEALLEVMNLPGAPQHPLPTVERAVEAEPDWLRGAPLTVLDLQPEIAAGQEPFPAIMAAARELKPGAVLVVLTPFEPAPLRTLLGKRGWESYARWEGETCHTALWRRPDAAPEAAAAPPQLDTRLRLTEAGAELDVRGLEPPQPLRAVLAAIAGGHLPLRVIHHRAPALLYPRLEEQGLRWATTEHDDHFEIQIDAAPSGAAPAEDARADE